MILWKNLSKSNMAFGKRGKTNKLQHEKCNTEKT